MEGALDTPAGRGSAVPVWERGCATVVNAWRDAFETESCLYEAEAPFSLMLGSPASRRRWCSARRHDGILHPFRSLA